jgi:hypothetical protein
MVEQESVLLSPGRTAKATNRVVKLVALSKATALAISRCQPMHLSVLVDWFGDSRIQDSQSLTMAHSSLLSNRLKASGTFYLVNTMVDMPAVRCPLRK